MKKTVNVEISGIDFVLNTDAYELLAEYLEEMEMVFSSLPEKKEILEDIEARIAEELVKISKKRVLSKAEATKVINAGHIRDILEKIGSPDEIDEVLGEFEYDKKTDVKPRLYRDPDNAIIGGVCSGIAAYFNVDPVIVRLIFLLLIFAGGISIIAYIILFFIVPEAKTPLQKMEMHGGGNALKRIDKGLRDIAKRFKIPEMTRKFEEKVGMKEDVGKKTKKT